MKKTKKFAVLLMAFVLLVASLSGCGKKASNSNFDISSAKPITENKMPITDEDIEISIYLENRSRGALETYADSEAMKELQKVTGIKVKFEHPVGSSKDQVNLMISSGTLPDVIFTDTYFYGAWNNTQMKKAAYDGMFLKLDEYIDKFAPNLKKYLEDNPEVNAQYHMREHDGSIYSIPSISSDPSFNYYDGYFIRKDWLDKLGLEVPQTIDEWEKVLRAFVTQDPNGNGEADEVGFSTFSWMTKYVFMPAFDIYNCNYYFNPKTNKITHGAVEPGFKEYVTMMNRWYEEGLVNPEYVSTDQKTLDYLVLNNKLGAFYCDNNNTAMKYVEGNPEMELIAVPFVKSPDGVRRTSKVDDVRLSGWSALISSQTKHPVEVVRFFDYLFSEEGRDLRNWGVKDVSYTVDENGNKKFTDLIMKDPKGRSIVEAYNAFTAAGVNIGFAGVFDNDVNKELNSILTPKQQALRNASMQYCAEVDKSAALPMSPTTLEEDETINNLSADLETYVVEMYQKFITGAEDISKYDEFLTNVNKMGMDKVLEIKQTAYERGLKIAEKYNK